MTHEFRNAYHFIPRKKLDVYPDFKADHDVYSDECLSGTITCTLTLEQVTVIGGKRITAEAPVIDYARLEPYMFQGQP